MKVLVSCVPQAGHLNPMVPLITALVRGGDDVVVATGDAVREQVAATGARLAPAGQGLDAWFGQLAARTRGMPGDGLPPERIGHYFTPRLFAEIACADMVDEVLAAGEQLRPDAVLFDAEAFVGPLAAELLGARPVQHQIGAMLPPDVLQLVTDAVSPLWRSFGRDVPADAGVYDGATIGVCPPSMEQRQLPRGQQLLLRSAPPPTGPADPAVPPLVYFTLGTLWANAGLVRTVIEALAGLPVRVVATLGALDPAELGPVPSNVEVHGFVPQADLLPRASLVIHHAGAGTMFGALAHGLPQLALPQAADNFINAELLAHRGAGTLLYPGQVSAGAVADAVIQLLDSETAKEAARSVAEEIDAMPTADEVAEQLRGL